MNISSSSFMSASAQRRDSSFWLPCLLVIVLVIPVELSFSIGDFRLTLSRLLLLLVAVPLLRRYLRLRIKMNYELMLFGYAVWLFVSLFVNHGLAFSLERAGSLGLEVVVSFLVASLAIVSIRGWVLVVKTVVLLVALILPLVVVESLVGQHFIHDFFFLLTGYEYPMPYEERLGLLRSSGPFNHPILLGVFSASLIGVVWCGVYGRDLVKRVVCVALLGANTFFSLSSAPVLLLFFQFFAIAYNRIAHTYKNRWHLIGLGFVGLYLVLSVVSNRSPFMVILSRITLDPSTSYYRLLTWEFGWESVLSNPFFGVGMNDWARPAWMITSSIDSIWLKTVILYGIPAVVMLLAATLMLIKTVVVIIRASEYGFYRQLCVGWIISMISLVLMGFTVDFFGEMHIYFFFMLGMGGALVNMKRFGVT